MRVMHVIFLSHEVLFRSFDRQRGFGPRALLHTATESVDDALQTPALPPHLASNIERYHRVLLLCVAAFVLGQVLNVAVFNALGYKAVAFSTGIDLRFWLRLLRFGHRFLLEQAQPAQRDAVL
mgnify:CR=1 FL=1